MEAFFGRAQGIFGGGGDGHIANLHQYCRFAMADDRREAELHGPVDTARVRIGDRRDRIAGPPAMTVDNPAIAAAILRSADTMSRHVRPSRDAASSAPTNATSRGFT